MRTQIRILSWLLACAVSVTALSDLTPMASADKDATTTISATGTSPVSCEDYNYMNKSGNENMAVSAVANDGRNHGALLSDYLIGDIGVGNYIDYTVYVETAGKYDVQMSLAVNAEDLRTVYLQTVADNVAEGTTIGTFQMSKPSDIEGQWDGYFDYRLYAPTEETVYLDAGKQTLRVFFAGGDMNYGGVSFTYAPAVTTISAASETIVRCEDFSAMEKSTNQNMRLVNFSDRDTGDGRLSDNALCDIAPGAYVDYVVNVETAGSYDVRMSFAAGNGGTPMALLQKSVDGEFETLSDVTVTESSFENWWIYTMYATNSQIHLDGGEQTLRVYFKDGNVNFGGMIFTYVPAESDVKLEDIKQSLILKSNIGMNFYAENAAFACVRVAGGELERIPFADGRATVELAAKQLTDQIDVYFEDAQGRATKTLSTSAKGYANKLLNPEADYTPQTTALVRAMLNYGAAAQLYFKYNENDLANADLAEADKLFPTDIDEKIKAFGIPTEQDGFYAMNLSLDSKVVMKLHFRDGTIRSREIYSGDLLTAANVDGISCNPMSYGCLVLTHRANDEALVNVIRSLYLYGVAAAAY